jgi:hypothetical protein
MFQALRLTLLTLGSALGNAIRVSGLLAVQRRFTHQALMVAVSAASTPRAPQR